MAAGLVCSLLIVGYILIRCYINPKMGPAIPVEERADWDAKIASLKGVILPLLLITAVLGSIYSGIATPTEAAAVGALGAFVCSASHRRLTWDLIKSGPTPPTVHGFRLILLPPGFAAVYMVWAPPGWFGLVQNTRSLVTMLIGIQVVWFILWCVIDA
jgi:TRAP-type mannitol/chloroaromatic compound transport system permease large subunit